MKFVYNEEKDKARRHLLMMQPTVEEAEAMIKKDETDAKAWYVYGKALGLKQDHEGAVAAYSRGIACDPFYAPNYLGRGCRKNYLKDSYWSSIADLTIAIRLEEDNWLNWYYRATTQNKAGYKEESIEDFKMCMKYSRANEHYPLVYWIYTTYVDMGKYEEAEKALELMADATIEPPQMDFGYCRSVRLFKGMVSPEEFIDIPLMQRSVLPRENRVNLELTGMYYGLYCYWMVHGDPEKAADAIREVQKIPYPGAFGYERSIPVAKKLGMIPEND
ncbi:MAG: hypothetical protein J6I64_04750 [Lachnospiraceae bacterium]|nr:hypothetical protein [Lachnospiraceae bacterium]